MNLKLSITAESPFYIKFNNEIKKYDQGLDEIVINYEPLIGKNYQLSIGSKDMLILKNHVIVNSIEFDNFWLLDGDSVCIGKNHYFPEYINFAVKTGIPIDFTVDNNNRLCFIGELIYSFKHPIYKFFHDRTTLY